MDQHIYNLAIIGGGPAGAAAAVYAARKRLKTVFITKDWLGQSNVSEKIENWIGTVAISGFELSQSLEKHAKTYSEEIIDFKEGERCIAIKKNSSKSFSITTDKGTYQSKTILIASGSHRRKLDLPGAEKYDNKGLTYCATCDGPLFKNQDVAVIGGGNAGFESAAQLLAYCRSVTLLIRGDTFKADPETIEKVTSNPKMKVIKFAVPKEVKGDKFVTSYVYNDTQTKKDVEIPVTGIFVEIGSLPNTDFTKEIIKLNNFGHVVTDAKNQRTSENGIWAAGDCTDGLYHQNNIAVGDAVKAIEDIYSWLNAK